MKLGKLQKVNCDSVSINCIREVLETADSQGQHRWQLSEEIGLIYGDFIG